MYFSEVFEVDKLKIEAYGAIDISLVCDLPLFVDPMLIFNSNKAEYKKLHDDIIDFFTYLTQKSQAGLSADELNTYFKFPEIKNNWFGYSKVKNAGRGLGREFAGFLSTNLKFIMADSNIAKSKHVEKALLLYDGNGKDKISDLTTNLILDFLAKYTEEFCKNNLDVKFIGQFFLDSKFNYRTESFESIEYQLPYIINDSGENEFVLLTPADILREEDPAISKIRFRKNYRSVRSGINNETHRAQLNSYLAKAIQERIIQDKKDTRKITQYYIDRIEKDAFIDATHEFPWIYDYFISLVEEDGLSINHDARKECQDQIEKFYNNSQKLRKLLYEYKDAKQNGKTAREELIAKVNYFKHVIENCEGYKLLYHNKECITTEDDLQRLFRFTLHNTPFDFNFETNNGLGELDVKVSKGSADKCIAEFKLASNSRLPNIFVQTKVYEAANQCANSIYVIFYFSINDEIKLDSLFKEYEEQKDLINSIILIDCRNDNKISASRRH